MQPRAQARPVLAGGICLLLALADEHTPESMPLHLRQTLEQPLSAVRRYLGRRVPHKRLENGVIPAPDEHPAYGFG